MTEYTIHAVAVFAECAAFVEGFSGDPVFSDPMLTTAEQMEHNLQNAFRRPETHRVLGVYREGAMAGLFAFLLLPQEKYGEMLAGLSRERGAYAEILGYVKSHFPGYGVDFVFNPRNSLLRECLAAVGAEFEPEQQKMVLASPTPPGDTEGVARYASQYARQYLAIHSRDGYWTGERVAATPDRFRIFLAIHQGRVVGYLDVTHCFEENEPYDLFVLPEYRRMGWGRKLLRRAVEENKPHGMMLLVDTANEAAIRLYQSVGFQKADVPNSQTARWAVPGQ